MKTAVNWFGVAGGALVLVVVAVSLFVPWWQLVAGEDLVTANVSPVNTSFNFTGSSFTVPLLFALNITSMILMISGGIAMLIYSVKPSASYAGKLLGFSYKKPLFTVILFVAGLFAATLIVKSIVGFEIPLMGATNVLLPAEMTQGTTVTVPIVTGFGWSFLLTLVAAGLCIAARLFHKKVAPMQEITVRQPMVVTTPPVSR
jgi:hypothetical protein